MKKSIRVICILCIVVVLAIIVISGCVFKLYCPIYELNRELNVNNLQLLMTHDDVSQSLNDYIQVGGFGGYYYYSIDESTAIVFSGFPDCINTRRLTKIATNSHAHSVFNITVGSDLESAKHILKENGYEKIHENDASKEYQNGRVFIELKHDTDNTITKINIHLHATNKKDILY